MSTDLRKLRKEERLRSKELRKDRLIQTRVDRRLQKVLVEQARSRRISVSNLVRNVLEDAFGLGEPDASPPLDTKTMSASVTPAPSATPSPTPAPSQVSVPTASLDHVVAWNAVIVGRDAVCSRCGGEMSSGQHGFIGLSDDPTAPRPWLCAACGEQL